VPIRIVVPLLRALVATPLAVIILPSVDGCPPIEASVGYEEARVPLSEAAVEVVVVVLVHPVLEVRVAVKVVALGGITWDGAMEMVATNKM